MSDSVILIGGGGHSKVVIDCIQASGGQAVGILDDGIAVGTSVLGVPVLGKIEDYTKYLQHQFLIAIGNNSIRRRISQQLQVKWYTAIHPSAVVSPHARIGVGTVVMPRAVINAGAIIGSHCIVNTGVIVEHDNRIADYGDIYVSQIFSCSEQKRDGDMICPGSPRYFSGSIVCAIPQRFFFFWRQRSFLRF